MKYVIFMTPEGQKLPVIFPTCLTHAYVAGAMQLALDTLDPKKDLRGHQCQAQLDMGEYPVVSAGFVAISGAHAHGESESIGVKSVPADTGRILLGHAVEFMPDDFVLNMVERHKKALSGK